MPEFEQALAQYRQLVVDMDGDGIPDAPLQQPMQRPEGFRERLERDPRGSVGQQPMNAMLTGPAADSRPSGAVVDRGTIVPLVEYEGGSFGPGLPGVIHAPISAANRMLTPGYDYSNTEQAARDAFDASGLAVTGGLAATATGMYPRGAVGQLGSGMRPGWFSGIVDKFVDPTQAVRRAVQQKAAEELRSIAAMVREGRLTPEQGAMHAQEIRRSLSEAGNTLASAPAPRQASTPPDPASNRMISGMSSSSPPPTSLQPPLPQSNLPQPHHVQGSAPVASSTNSPAAPVAASQVSSQIPVPSTSSRPVQTGSTQTQGGGQTTRGRAKEPPAARKKELMDQMANGDFSAANAAEQRYINDIYKQAKDMADEGQVSVNQVLRMMNAPAKKGSRGRVYGVAGAPTIPETDSRGQEHHRGEDGRFMSPGDQ